MTMLNDAMNNRPFAQTGDQASGAASVTDVHRGVVAFVADAAVVHGRRLAVKCTVAGNVNVTLLDGSTETVPVLVGLTLLPLAVVKVNSATTTATATYSNWL
jgi:hypothetical protein